MYEYDRVKHLEMLQNVIGRMNQNSFHLKGWSVTLVAALLVVCTTVDSASGAWFFFLPVASFWFLDAYYLHQEKLFRRLYDAVREASEVPPRCFFVMDTSKWSKEVPSLLSVMGSTSVSVFHGTIVVIASIVSIADARW